VAVHEGGLRSAGIADLMPLALRWTVEEGTPGPGIE
jgi:hypothetical protein